MRTKRSSKTQYYLMSVTPVSDAQLMALLGEGETVPVVEPTPVPVTRKYGFKRGNKPLKKPAAKVKSGRGGARPGAGHKPPAVTKHQRIVNQVVSLLERRGPSHIVDLFDALESNGSADFGIRKNTPRTVRLGRFRAVLQNEGNRTLTPPKVIKVSPGVVALPGTK